MFLDIGVEEKKKKKAPFIANVTHNKAASSDFSSALLQAHDQKNDKAAVAGLLKEAKESQVFDAVFDFDNQEILLPMKFKDDVLEVDEDDLNTVSKLTNKSIEELTEMLGEHVHELAESLWDEALTETASESLGEMAMSAVAG